MPSRQPAIEWTRAERAQADAVAECFVDADPRDAPHRSERHQQRHADPRDDFRGDHPQRRHRVRDRRVEHARAEAGVRAAGGDAERDADCERDDGEDRDLAEVERGDLARRRAERFHDRGLPQLLDEQRVDHVGDEHGAEREGQRAERAEEEEEGVHLRGVRMAAGRGDVDARDLGFDRALDAFGDSRMWRSSRRSPFTRMRNCCDSTASAQHRVPGHESGGGVFHPSRREPRGVNGSGDAQRLLAAIARPHEHAIADVRVRDAEGRLLDQDFVVRDRVAPVTRSMRTSRKSRTTKRISGNH